MMSDTLSDLDEWPRVLPSEPHIGRARAILQAHPEVRSLLGPTPSTFLVLLALVTAQTALALLLRNEPWWVLVLVAYFVGAVLNCAVLNMVHEASHGLIFRSRKWNLVAAYIANLGTFSPYVETFYHYHLPHHRYLGVYDRDATIARDWEARIVGRSALRKLIWFLFFPLIYPFRLTGISLGQPATSRIARNFAVQALWLGLLYSVGGCPPLIYLGLSLYLHFGLHPLNAIALQEHFYVQRGQESSSYYGVGNWISLNAGYHVEHHDFPYMAWSRLRKLRALAPEFYDGRLAYHSWSGLILRFVRDRRWSLWARAVRTDNPADLAGSVIPADASNELSSARSPGNGVSSDGEAVPQRRVS